jgi:hypothetical protein
LNSPAEVEYSDQYLKLSDSGFSLSINLGDVNAEIELLRTLLTSDVPYATHIKLLDLYYKLKKYVNAAIEAKPEIKLSTYN